NLPVSRMALIVFVATYLIAAGVYLVVIKLAETEWARPCSSRTLNRSQLPSSRACTAFVHEGHCLGSSHIAYGKLLNAKSIALDDVCNRAIEMATAGQVLPCRCQNILPPADARFWSEAVFHEQEFAARLQHPAHFSKCLIKVGNAAHGPGRHDRIDACIAE